MSERLSILLSLAIVTIFSFFTYFYHYSNPPFFFWDENYHVASAQKYLNRVFFMEPHPPLGKLLIALGEALLDENDIDNQFIGTDHAKFTPENFSFKGYRLMPSLLAWLTAPLFFLLIFSIIRKVLPTFFFSLLYVFDNALIVHGRGAMLESIQIFFIVATLLFLIQVYTRLKNRESARIPAFFCGVSCGLAVATKITALILGIAFLPFALILLGNFKKGALTLLTIVASFLAVQVIVWQIHFSLGQQIETSLPNGGYYQASTEYREILLRRDTKNILNFPTMLSDALGFVPHYQKGVPRLNLCNQSENGSSPFLWPFGARSINYRWEKKDGLTRYLYLQANPASWLIGLLGVVGGFSVLLSVWCFGLRRPLHHLLWLSLLFLMWAVYMAVMLRLDRVMYLYHYFIPLLFSYVMAAIVFEESRRFGPVHLSHNLKFGVMTIGSFCIMGCYYFFSPLTYALPLSSTQIKDRAWLDIWDLRCEQCDLVNPIARPTCDPKIKPFPGVSIGEVKAKEGFQDWGEPRLNSTVEQRSIEIQGKRYERGIGVHANSTLVFPLAARYQELSGACALPDSIKEKSGTRGSIVCEVFGDSKFLWRSKVVRTGDEPQSFTAAVKGVNNLELKILDAGDGIDNDHGVWVNLSLR